MSIRRALYAFPRLGVSRRVRWEPLVYRSVVGPKNGLHLYRGIPELTSLAGESSYGLIALQS